MKIGLVTWCGGPNIGTNLQTYSLIQALNQLNCQCQYVRMCLNLEKEHSFKHRLYNLFRTLYLGNDPEEKYIYAHAFTNKERRQRILLFNKRHIPIHYIHTYKKYHSLLNSFDVFLTGSDQIWNPHYLYPFFLLDFAVGKKKCIAYSSSLGVSQVPQEAQKLYCKYLNLFKAIAVREKTGEIILSQILDRNDIVTVLDPVFLLKKEEWEDLANEADMKEMPTEPFLFCYVVGENDFYATQVQRIQEVLHISCTIVMTSTCYSKSKIKGTYYEWGGNAEFLWLLKQATFICTDSFHATALSIILQKDFVTLMRFSANDEKSQNSRLNDLLARYSLNDRLFVSQSEKWANKVNYPSIEQMVKNDINFSIGYLRKALDLC